MCHVPNWMERVRNGELSGPLKSCEYYPCHFEGQDCTFCYCPFYPCLLYRLGGEIIKSSNGKFVWSCKDCRWIHERDNVEEILDYFSSFPRQLIAESDWYFFNKSLQMILFGSELGEFINGVYNLMPANFYKLKCSEIEEARFLAVRIKDFNIEYVREIKSIEEAINGEIIIPKKSNGKLRGIYKNKFVECKL